MWHCLNLLKTLIKHGEKTIVHPWHLVRKISYASYPLFLYKLFLIKPLPCKEYSHFIAYFYRTIMILIKKKIRPIAEAIKYIQARYTPPISNLAV